ncbi:MAG: ASKHA domain-containing protein [Pseudomonadota bacterium]
MSDKVELRVSCEQDQERLVAATRGDTILDAAHSAGIEIPATCGARGRCRSCRVKVLDGTVPPPTVQDTLQLGFESVRERFRLACQTKLIDDTTVRPMPPKSESGYQILGGGAATTAMALEAGVEKQLLTVEPPKSEHHQTSDLDEVFAALGERLTSRHVAAELVRDLPAKLRERKGEITATLFRGQLVDLEAGDTTEHCYGMAFDIGTTSIVGSLLDLKTGEELAAVGMINPQAPFGADLMSRIAFAQFNPKNLQQLRGKALNALNDLIKEACAEAEIPASQIYKIVVVGNTCMHHVLLGIDVSYLGLAPYAPVIRDAQTLAAAELPLKAAPRAHVCTLPILAGFVGADALACVLSTRIYDSQEIRVLVDIGTNGEMVIGSRDRLVACSAPAGPAFEGAQIRHGMRGAIGAIERVKIDQDVHCGVIGGDAAVGICGSGLIEACARMTEAGVINPSGAMTRDTETLPAAVAKRVIKSDHGAAFVLAWAEDSGKGEDITLTQGDIRQLQLAKSAIFSGVAMLQKEMEVAPEQVTELMLCGGFGNYVDVASAVAIRLLPEMPVERISYVGNAALMGAQMALLSEAEWTRAEELLGSIEHVALAARPDFQDLFIDGMRFGSQKPKDAHATQQTEVAV